MGSDVVISRTDVMARLNCFAVFCVAVAVSVTTRKTPYSPSNVAIPDCKHNQHWDKCTEILLIYPSHAVAIMVYITVIRPVLEYCAPLWHYALTNAQSEAIEAVQKHAIHIIYNSTRGLQHLFMLFYANLNLLALHKENLSRRFLCNIMDPASGLHSLLPPPRSTLITSRLISSQTFPKIYPYQVLLFLHTVWT